MSVRKASIGLQRVVPAAPLAGRDPPPAERDLGALDWQGEVRLDAGRAAGLSAALWQQHVRTGLLERAVALGADHRAGPHLERPEVARRLLAHIDALAEAGLTPAELAAFAGEADLEHPGAAWALAILFGCLEAAGVEDAFEGWLASLDGAAFPTYGGVLEIAEAIATQPSEDLRDRARRWAASVEQPVLAGIALEMTPPGELPGEALAALARVRSPLVQAAVERYLARTPLDPARPAPARASWIDVESPAFAYEVARARMLQRDLEPLDRVRRRDPRALAALGPHALDVIALAGYAGDGELARDLAAGIPSTPGSLDAMGRIGLPSLFPRLLAELGSDELDEDAHGALVTALGDRVAAPTVAAWEAAIAALPAAAEAARLRGGEPHSPRSVIAEMRRPDLSAGAVRVRADELLARAGRPAQVAWDAFGATLEGALSDLARLAR
ncbi:hypothetical protein WME75_16745 [Sorangium sp. So ce1014]|uniref:hypothetical protein n=1 Tax=Sorangium sp. So ce1014 TaxID=3133326 RepID=UPI003F5E9D62